jgi:hypothetical protein
MKQNRYYVILNEAYFGIIKDKYGKFLITKNIVLKCFI